MSMYVLTIILSGDIIYNYNIDLVSGERIVRQYMSYSVGQ